MESPIDDSFGEFVPPPAREDKVRALVAAALAGMSEKAASATETEVFSACMTLCAITIQAAHNMGAKPSSLSRSGMVRSPPSLHENPSAAPDHVYESSFPDRRTASWRRTTENGSELWISRLDFS